MHQPRQDRDSTNSINKHHYDTFSLFVSATALRGMSVFCFKVQQIHTRFAAGATAPVSVILLSEFQNFSRSVRFTAIRRGVRTREGPGALISGPEVKSADVMPYHT
jgi:hypothetical protein